MKILHYTCLFLSRFKNYIVSNFRMGQTCNHVAALLFRVESANKLGLTSCTSLPCQWKVPAATKVVPTKIKDLTIRKSRHGQGIFINSVL